MKAYDEDAEYILFINKSITILGCSTVNSLTIGFLGHIFQQKWIMFGAWFWRTAIVLGVLMG